MIKKILVILLWIPICGEASEPKIQMMVGVGQTWLVQKASNGQVADFYQPFSLKAGAQRESLSIFLEYARNRVETGVYQMNIRQTRNELMLWSRYTLLNASKYLAPFAALGFGGFWDQVHTRFQSEDVRQTGRLEPQFAQALGMEWRALQYASLMAELRLAEARTHNANPLWGLNISIEGRF